MLGCLGAECLRFTIQTEETLVSVHEEIGLREAGRTFLEEANLPPWMRPSDGIRDRLEQAGYPSRRMEV